MSPAASRWIRYNLFASPMTSVLSVVGILLTVYVALRAGTWVFFSAKWSVVTDNLTVLLVGTFPHDQLWRAFLAGAVIAVLIGLTIGAVLDSKRQKLAVVVAAVALVTAALSVALRQPALAASLACIGLAASARIIAVRFAAVSRVVGLGWVVGLGAICAILAPAGVSNWGGLLASILVTAIATLLSIPFGIMLAFGKTSRYASVRIACSGYIEVIRSIPVISIIYWAWIIFPLVFPPDVHVADLTRGIIAFVMFYGAYAAEYVRAGLQGVPRGQFEAAQALGFRKIDESFIIVLPQALKSVIPALVGNVLDLFNNVPALFIIGLTDFLKAGQTVLANPQYSGSQYEVYVFLFTVYLVVGALISYVARRIEIRMNRGAR